MEAELTSLDSQLERAKLAQAARCSRLEAAKTSETEASPLSKRVLFPDEIGVGGKFSHPTLDPDLQADKTDQWTPQLDLSHETKVNISIASCFRLWIVLSHVRGGRSCWGLLFTFIMRYSFRPFFL